MLYGQPAQLANLNPFRGTQPNNTGKEYKHSSDYIFKKYLQKKGDTVDGEEATRFDMSLFLIIRDAMDKTLAPVDRHRAINIILDRLEGKAVQPSDIKVRGAIDLTVTNVAEMSNAQLEAMMSEKYKRLEDGSIVEVDFEVIENGESSAEMPSAHRAEPN